MKTSRVIALVSFGLLVGFLAGWNFCSQDRKARREEMMENIRQVMLASKIYALAYSNNPTAITELLTNQPVSKP